MSKLGIVATSRRPQTQTITTMSAPIEMKMEAANDYADREVKEMLEEMEDEFRESEFAAYAEVRKIRSDKFKTEREDA